MSDSISERPAFWKAYTQKMSQPRPRQIVTLNRISRRFSILKCQRFFTAKLWHGGCPKKNMKPTKGGDEMKTVRWFLIALFLAGSFIASSTPARAQDDNDSDLTMSSWQDHIQDMRFRGNDME